MKLGTFLMASAAVAAIFGVALVLAPGMLLPIYGGMSMEPYVEQLLGAQLIGFAVLNWFARKTTDRESVRPILLANLAANVIGLVLALLEEFSGGENVVGWSTVVICLVLAVGFGYFLLRPGAAKASVAQAQQ